MSVCPEVCGRFIHQKSRNEPKAGFLWYPHFELVDNLVVISFFPGMGGWAPPFSCLYKRHSGGLRGNPYSARSPRASPCRFSLRMSNGARDRRLGAFLGGMGELARHEDVRHVFGASFVQRVGAS